MIKTYLISYIFDYIYAIYFVLTEDSIEKVQEHPLRYLMKNYNLNSIRNYEVNLRKTPYCKFNGEYYYTDQDFRNHVLVSEMPYLRIDSYDFGNTDLGTMSMLFSKLSLNDLNAEQIADYSQLIISRHFYRKYGAESMAIFGSPYINKEWEKNRRAITVSETLDKVSTFNGDYGIISTADKFSDFEDVVKW